MPRGDAKFPVGIPYILRIYGTGGAFYPRIFGAGMPNYRGVRFPVTPGALSDTKKLKQFLFRSNLLAGVLYVLTEPEGHLVSYSILCP